MAKITLYENANYSGQKLELDTSDANFVEDNFNDKLSSLRVESGTWTLYSDINFGNPSVTVSPNGGPENDGQYPTADWLGGRNDYFSSIRLNE